MKIKVVAYLASLVPMLLLDGVWLGLLAREFYAGQLGELMADKVNIPAAITFYLLYALGVSLLVVAPAVRANAGLIRTFFSGALLGLVAYGTYDLTNQAVLKGWPLAVTLVDLAWGTVLTGAVAAIATVTTRKLG